MATICFFFNLHLLLWFHSGVECTCINEISTHCIMWELISTWSMNAWTVFRGQIEWERSKESQKKKLCWMSGIRNREGRGRGFQMGHAEGVDFQVSPVGNVWPNRKWQGAFEGLDTERINLAFLYPHQVSRGIHHIHGGQVREALLPGLFVRHLWGPQGNVALVRSVSCLPFHACRSRPGA